MKCVLIFVTKIQFTVHLLLNAQSQRWRENCDFRKSPQLDIVMQHLKSDFIWLESLRKCFSPQLLL